MLQVRLFLSLLYKFSYKTPWLSLLQWKSLRYMYFIALTPEKQLSFLFIHLYAHIPLFYRASNISNYAERLSYSAKLAGPSQVQFYPLIRRRIQSAKRISFFSQHHFGFFLLMIKTFPKAFVYQWIADQIFSFFLPTNRSSFILLFWISKHFYEINVKVK